MDARLPAEWEQQSAIQITFPHENSDWKSVLPIVIPCFVEIIETISKFQKVIVVCNNKKQTADLLTDANIENLIFAEIASNDTWARDHGGITVEQKGRNVILDFQFTGWGNKFEATLDNQITNKLFEKGIFKNTNIEKVNFVLEGGAIESNGSGTLLTTSECLLNPNRNLFTKNEIEKELEYYFGIQHFLWLNNGYLAGDDTDSHIDTLARFCNETTIAYVKCEDEKDEHFSALSKMELELKAFKQKDGTPYSLVSLPFPDAIYDDDGERLPATYANFLIMNQVVLVPIYDVPQDNLALSTFQKVFFDREIIGINCKPLILQHGSLHCITMQYPIGIV